MITYEEAIKKIAEHSTAISVGTEKVALLQALGRVLAEEIISEENIPYADNSGMDGFALNADETLLASVENPLFFNVHSVIAAGDSANEKTREINSKKSCLEIMTGGLLANNYYDAVVKVEDVKREANQITLTAPVRKANNVRPKGTDFAIGQSVLSKNTVLKDQHIMALAALGIAPVTVKKKIRVAVLSTGNEIVSFENKNPKEFQVRNSSAPFLKVFLERHHCAVTLLGVHNDDPSSFYQVMSGLLKAKYDLIITTGAVSMGKWDFIGKTLPDLKMQTIFHKVAIRPGKPILLAQATESKTILFGLPGNPISTAVGAQFFILPLLEKVMQLKTQEKWVPLEADVSKPEGLECFFKAVLNPDFNSAVKVLTAQASYMIHSFAQSNCWVQLPAAGNMTKAGTLVRVIDI